MIIDAVFFRRLRRKGVGEKKKDVEIVDTYSKFR